MGPVVIQIPPPMRKRALHLMLSRAQRVKEDGENVILTYCAETSGTCSANLAGSRLVCSACRFSSRRTAEATGLQVLPLRSDVFLKESPTIQLRDATELISGVQSCLITALRAMNVDLNRIARLRRIKRRYFRTSARLLAAFNQLLIETGAERVEVLNGRFACTKIGLMAARRRQIDFNTLDFNTYGKPMVFRGHTPHDRGAVQQRIQQNVADREVAARYFASRRHRSVNRFAASHRQFEPPENAVRYERRVTFFLSSQDECESLGPAWRSPFRDNPKVIRAACERFPNYFFSVRFHPNQKTIVGDVTGPYKALSFENLRVFYPNDDVDSYRLMEWSDIIVTFASTVAVEACWAGKPVVELGPSYFDQLGISYTPHNTDEFLALLEADLQPHSTDPAARFANYELYDFDELRSQRIATGGDDGTQNRRRGSLLAKAAKEMNNIVTWLLRKISERTLTRLSRSA